MVVQNGDEIMTGMIKNSLLSGKVKAAGTVRSILVGMLLLLGLALQLPAETVGLWKMDYSETTGFNYRSLVNPAHDLLPIASVTSGTSAGWELPPNPDRSFVPLDSLKNVNALRAGNKSGLRAPGLGPYVEVTTSFTIEGWIKRTENPTASLWHYILGTRNSGDGWLLTLRIRNGLIRYELFGQNCVTDGSLFDTPISPDDTNAWHHLALVYEHDAISANRGVWELF